jgi:hypothetical protein
LASAGRLAEIAAGLKVYDAWGHDPGLDGALADDMIISVK